MTPADASIDNHNDPAWRQRHGFDNVMTETEIQLRYGAEALMANREVPWRPN